MHTIVGDSGNVMEDTICGMVEVVPIYDMREQDNQRATDVEMHSLKSH